MYRYYGNRTTVAKRVNIQLGMWGVLLHIVNAARLQHTSLNL
jgi:hypothetical protein